MMKKTDSMTVDELLHLTLLRNAVNKNDKDTFDKLNSPDYKLISVDLRRVRKPKNKNKKK